MSTVKIPSWIDNLTPFSKIEVRKSQRKCLKSSKGKTPTTYIEIFPTEPEYTENGDEDME